MLRYSNHVQKNSILQSLSYYTSKNISIIARIFPQLKTYNKPLLTSVFSPISRKNLSLQPVDREEDAHLFTYRDVNRTHVSVVLAQSVDSLVDSDSPQNVVKFRLGCDFDSGDDLVSCMLYCKLMFQRYIKRSIAINESSLLWSQNFKRSLGTALVNIKIWKAFNTWCTGNIINYRFFLV